MRLALLTLFVIGAAFAQQPQQPPRRNWVPRFNPGRRPAPPPAPPRFQFKTEDTTDPAATSGPTNWNPTQWGQNQFNQGGGGNNNWPPHPQQPAPPEWGQPPQQPPQPNWPQPQWPNSGNQPSQWPQHQPPPQPPQPPQQPDNNQQPPWQMPPWHQGGGGGGGDNGNNNKPPGHWPPYGGSNQHMRPPPMYGPPHMGQRQQRTDLTQELIDECARKPDPRKCQGVPTIFCNAWLPEGPIEGVRVINDEVKEIATSDPYEANKDLRWIVYAPCGKRLEYKVKSIQLVEKNADGECPEDSVQVSRHGDAGNLGEKQCGSEAGKVENSFGNSLFVQFNAGENGGNNAGVVIQVRIASQADWPA